MYITCFSIDNTIICISIICIPYIISIISISIYPYPYIAHVLTITIIPNINKITHKIARLKKIP